MGTTIINRATSKYSKMGSACVIIVPYEDNIVYGMLFSRNIVSSLATPHSTQLATMHIVCCDEDDYDATIQHYTTLWNVGTLAHQTCFSVSACIIHA